jgi:hypothetical protein
MRLLNLSNEKIVELLDEMDSDSKAINKNLIEMCWYMRGGITYSEIVQLSPMDRKHIMELIKSNMETTNKSGLPFF